MPSALAATGVTPATYYQQIRFCLQTDRVQHPEKYTDIAASLADFPNQARPLADDLRTKIAEPTLDAASLFNQHSTMTRLYSTLSPEDMNKDPVFSYNPSLPPYPNEHTATLTYHCGGFFSSQRYSSATLELPSGLHREFSIDQVNGGTYPAIDAPYSEQIQILRETGEARDRRRQQRRHPPRPGPGRLLADRHRRPLDRPQRGHFAEPAPGRRCPRRPSAVPAAAA